MGWPVLNFSWKGVPAKIHNLVVFFLCLKRERWDSRLSTATQSYVTCVEWGEPGQPSDWRYSDWATHPPTHHLLASHTLSFATPPTLHHSLVTKCTSQSHDHFKLHGLLIFICSILRFIVSSLSKPYLPKNYFFV